MCKVILLKEQPLPDVQINIDAAVKHLCEAIAIQTISYSDESKVNWDEFRKFHRWLEQTYPAVHKNLVREVVQEASLLYLWKGKDKSLKPAGFLAHMDVVPAEEAALKDWIHPPFKGVADNDAIWGRGASDMKNHLIALFETIETLLNEGYEPERDIYLCIGHNEEVQVGSRSGARTMAGLLHERGIRFEFILDEGGAISENLPFGISHPAAMIGLAEKGYADFRITVSDEGGHAAEPPPNTALGKLAKVLTAIEKKPMKQKLVPIAALTFDAFSRRMNLLMRVIFANMWFFKPLIMHVFSKDKQTNAMTRTTIAATMAEASPAPNVLPQRASAILNVRLLPGNTAEDVLKHLMRTTAKTSVQINIELIKESPAVEMSSRSWVYETILHCLPVIQQGIFAVPYLVTGATDSREYIHLTDEIYRFYPFILNMQELSCMHAANERIRQDSLAGALKFLYHFIKQAGNRT
jgi:carboxypeptidase PM20D1